MQFTSVTRLHVPDQAVRHYVDRAYREGAPFQWARELYKNSEEAGATRVEFGIEPQAAKRGVFRIFEVDNGHGMDDEHLVTYFKMLGVGGKPIGGPHENYGHGARVSLLPWNAYGVVVISRKNGADSMIWMCKDADGNYCLREWEVEDEDGAVSLTPVVEPYDDSEDGTDWRKIIPEWVGDHGTAFVLLGNTSDDHTIDGDPRYPEEAVARGLHQYLGGRLMRLKPDITLVVNTREELTTSVKTRRKTRDVALGLRDGVLIGSHARRVYGLDALLTKDGSCKTGIVAVDEYGSAVQWYLRDENAPAITDSLPFNRSFIAVEYEDEVYEHEQHSAKFRMFGIAQEDVRNRVWLVIKPPVYDPRTAIGVYTNQSRSQLLWRGNGLPLSDWGLKFAQNLPRDIREALAKAWASEASEFSTLEHDKERREKLAARFGKRWRAIRYVINKMLGTVKVDPVEGQLPKRPRKPRNKITPPDPNHHTGKGGSGSGGPATLGTPNPDGGELAVERRVGVDLPKAQWIPARDLGDDRWAAAAWAPTLTDTGTIMLNQDHPLFLGEIQQWQSTRPNHLADEVRKVVQEVYADLAVAHVAHVRNFSGTRVDEVVVSHDKVEQMLTPPALTCALAGLLGAEAMIQTRLGGRFGRAA